MLNFLFNNKGEEEMSAIVDPNKDNIPSNITVFSASSGSQISCEKSLGVLRVWSGHNT